jgi:thiol-disulfide isomerase/thioredoxin
MKFIDIEDETNINELKEILNNKNNKIFLLIYAKWCGHCKTLLPKWKQIKDNIENKCEKDNNLIIVSVEYEPFEKNNINIDEEINAFPTIKYLHDGKVETYENENELKEIIEWIESKSLCKKPYVLGGNKMFKHKIKTRKLNKVRYYKKTKTIKKKNKNNNKKK